MLKTYQLSRTDDIIIEMQSATSDNWLGKPFYSSNTALLTKDMASKILVAQEKYDALGYTIQIWDA